MLDQIKENEKNRDEDGDTTGDGIIGVAQETMIDDVYYRREVTAADVETVYGYACTAKKQFVYDTSLFDIINEEASAYFAGTKTLDEILPLMESRITIFLSEGR